MEGKRLLSICKLRLNVVLYSELYLSNKEIIKLIENKLKVY
jgi:hypothetical protein